MNNALLECRANNSEMITGLDWVRTDGREHECRVLLCPEEVGGFSAHALQLPGVVSEGDTIEEALDNIRDAFQEAFRLYAEEGAIPWAPAAVDRRDGSFERWIVVNV